MTRKTKIMLQLIKLCLNIEQRAFVDNISLGQIKCDKVNDFIIRISIKGK